jgi:hypothetical protein
MISTEFDGKTLIISGSFTGDQFPSTEAFVRSRSGNNKFFLGAKKEQGGIKRFIC